MKIKLIVAFIFFLVGMVNLVDWILFSVRDENKSMNWEDFKLKYLNRLPAFLQPFYERPILSTSIFIVLFSIAGLIFIKEDRKIFKALGIVSFVLGFWELFSLM